jgi:hypothetical protein
MFLTEFPIFITFKEFHMHKHSSSAKHLTCGDPSHMETGELYSISCEKSGITLTPLRILIHAEIQQYRSLISDTMVFKHLGK